MFASETSRPSIVVEFRNLLMLSTKAKFTFQKRVSYNVRSYLEVTRVTIRNFKNFLSLHIFAQSLAEQKHALKIFDAQNRLQLIFKNAKNQHTLHNTQGFPGTFGYPGPNLTWCPT
jgi:hypothetical protein